MPRKVLVVGDIHAPFHNAKALQSIYRISEKFKPQIIIQVGDAADMLAFSKFPRSHNVMTPRDEILKTRDILEGIWKSLKKTSPKAECFQLIGNHVERPFKRILEKAPEFESFLSLRDYMEFPGVETIHDARQELELDGVIYIHGYLSQLGAHARYFQKSVVCGHSHKGGVVFMRQRNKTIFELNAGFVGLEGSPGLSYTQTRQTQWTLGCGVIDELGPRFIPL